MLLQQQSQSPPRTRRRLVAPAEGSSSGDPTLLRSSGSVYIRGRQSITMALGKLSKPFEGIRSSTGSRSSYNDHGNSSQRKRLRFDESLNRTQIVTKHENKLELWYQRRELMGIQAQCFKQSREESAQGYLNGTSLLYDHVVRNNPMHYQAIAHISIGLEDGLRGLERWTESGKVRRLRTRAIVNKIVTAQGKDVAWYAQTLTRECQIWAELTGRMDALAQMDAR